MFSAQIRGLLGVLLLVSALVMFTCKQCPENFATDSSRGLSLHQKKCPAYIRQTQDIFNARRTLGSHKLKQRSTLKARKLRLQDVDDSTGAENMVPSMVIFRFN